MFKNILYGLSLVLLTLSCTEKIDIQLDESQTRLVVEGYLTNESKEHMVRLSKSAPYFSNQTAPVVEGATIRLNVGETNLTLTEKTPGMYVTPADYTGVPGKLYQLTIELAEPINDQTTFTATSLMRNVVQSDSIEVEYHSDWGKGIWEVKWYAQEPSGDDYYLFKAYKNDSAFADSLKNWITIDDRFIDGNNTNGIGVKYFWKIRKQIINPGDKITLQVCGITKEYQNYVEFSRRAVNQQNPMFSGPPTNVPGNISNGAIGYFAAYAVSYASTTYSTTP
jgi:hypothetical protein